MYSNLQPVRSLVETYTSMRNKRHQALLEFGVVSRLKELLSSGLKTLIGKVESLLNKPTEDELSTEVKTILHQFVKNPRQDMAPMALEQIRDVFKEHGQEKLFNEIVNAVGEDYTVKEEAASILTVMGSFIVLSFLTMIAIPNMVPHLKDMKDLTENFKEDPPPWKSIHSIEDEDKEAEEQPNIKFKYKIGDTVIINSDKLYIGHLPAPSLQWESAEIDDRRYQPKKGNLYTIITGYNGARNNKVDNVPESYLTGIDDD